MRHDRFPLLSSIVTISLLASCALPLSEGSSLSGQAPKLHGFVAPAKLESDSHIVEGCEKALSAYGSFASKIVKDKAMRSESNSVYSPLSHYLCQATVVSLLDNPEKETLNSLGASSTEELASFVDELVRLESLVTDDPDYYGIVEMANLVANFDEYWSKEKVDIVAERLHAAYLDDYGSRETSIAEWKKELSHDKLKNPASIELENAMITFVSGLYVDLLYELSLNEETKDAPFDGEGEYPFLQGETYGSLYEDEEVLAFSQSCRARDYRIRYVMPKVAQLDDYIEDVDYVSLFDKTSPKDKYVFEVPSVSIASQWSLSDLGKAAGFRGQENYRFLSGGHPYEALESTQSIDLGFKYDGVKAYAESKVVMIPQSAPVGIVSLNRPFAFELVGRDGAVLIHGRVKTLDV